MLGCAYRLPLRGMLRGRCRQASRPTPPHRAIPQAPLWAQAAAKAAWLEDLPRVDFGDLSQPLDDAERRLLWTAFGDGATGESQFKAAAAEHLGPAAQEATCALVEASVRTALAPACLKRATVVWADKPNGGTRGLSLMEELMKAAETVVCQRTERAMQRAPSGTVLSASNVGFQKARGCSLVLDLTADFWDHARQSPGVVSTHLPWDFRSYFDELDLVIADAIMAARGVPEPAGDLLLEVHTRDACMRACTPWGWTAPVQRKIGAHQGSSSGPLLSRFAGEVVARLVDAHEAPASVHDVLLAQQSLVDDGKRSATGRAVGRSPPMH